MSKIDKINSEVTTTKADRDEKAKKLQELEDKLKTTTTIDPATQGNIG